MAGRWSCVIVSSEDLNQIATTQAPPATDGALSFWCPPRCDSTGGHHGRSRPPRTRTQARLVSSARGGARDCVLAPARRHANLLIENVVRREMRHAGFREVRTPQLLARSLWERSGHWAKFGSNMFAFAIGERAFALKPMNCPGHVQMFKDQIRSYRDLPLRFSEFGMCHRFEPSGTLHGLMRGRAFTQDDAHVFCLPEHTDSEVARFCALLRRVYARFGFREFGVGFSTRPQLREGSDDLWDQAEKLLADAGRKAGLELRLQPGEGAFYGPKLEFILGDRDGREWQCGTIQLDLILPDKLDAKIVDASGADVRPMMIHHAVLGSIERF